MCIKNFLIEQAMKLLQCVLFFVAGAPKDGKLENRQT